jgi:glycosyltransferase involved in cell wall biosynthesis
VRAIILSSHYADPANRGKLRALAGLGCDLIAAIPNGTASLDAGVRLVPIPVHGSLDEPASLKWNGRTLKRLLTDNRPDILQIEEDPETPAADTAASLARRLGIPYVVFSWQSLPRRLGFVERLRTSRTLRGAAGAIGGNRLAELLLREHAGQALTTTLPQTGVPLPPVLDRRPGSEGEGLAIGFIGRLVPERGLDQLLRALGQTYGAWHLTILGTGPEQEATEELVQRLGLASRIRWLGGIRRELIDEMWTYLDCLVVPSRDTPTWVERSSPLLLEAMARGITAVVTPAGALPELIGDAGVIAPDLEALTLALQQFVADPSKCRGFGVRGRERVLDQFVESAVATRTLAFWEAIKTEAESSRRAG